MKTQSVIIGGGLAGLACASKMQKEKHDFLIIEQLDRLGGRVGSIYEDKFIFDVGFQVYNTAYSNTNSLLKVNEIDLKFFKPGARIHDGKYFQIISDPMRDISQLFSSLFSSLSSFSDKMKILLLKYELSNYSIEKDIEKDCSTLEYLQSRGFSEKIIKLFFEPFFAGIFLEKRIETSSKIFKYVFSNFSKGLAALPSNGMQKIPDAISKNIRNDLIMYNSRVIRIKDNNTIILDNSKEIKADTIILTGDSHELIGNKPKQYNSVTNLYFSSSIIPDFGSYIHLFPKDEMINNVAFLSSISSNYSPISKCLISVSILGLHDSKSLKNVIQKKLSKYFGGSENDYNLIKSFELKKATIKQPANYFSNNLVKSEKNIIVAGDHTVNGSIEGAVISGLNAYKQIKKLK